MTDLTKFYRQASWHLAVLNWGLLLSLTLNYEQSFQFGTEIEFSIPEPLISSLQEEYEKPLSVELWRNFTSKSIKVVEAESKISHVHMWEIFFCNL